MKMKVAVRVAIAKEMLLGAISTAEITREWVSLAACRDRLVADEVLRQSCVDAVESAEDLLTTLRAEENEHMAVKLKENLSAAVKKAQTADKDVDVSSDVTGYKQ